MRFSYIGLLFAVGVVLCPTFALAESAPKAPAEDVVLIEPDGTLVMAGGVRMVLAGVIFPDYDAAIGKIMELLQGRKVRVKSAAQQPDRYGRVAGFLIRQDGLDVTEALLRSGLAVGWMGHAQDHLVRAEQTAREEGLGYWGADAGRVMCVDVDGNLPDSPTGQLRFVRGRVAAVGRAGGNIYLNFGDDWREDFTIALPQGREEEFLEVPAENLIQQMVEVRGWLRSENGPLVELSMSHQMVQLNDPILGAGEPPREGSTLACNDPRGIDQGN